LAADLQELSVAVERRHRQHADTSAQQLGQLGEDLRGGTAALNTRLCAVEKGLGEVSTDLPAWVSRWEASEKAHGDMHEEIKKAAHERGLQVHKKIQSHIETLTHQLGAAQEEWKVRHHEGIQSVLANVQNDTQHQATALAGDIAAVQQEAHMAQKEVLRVHREHQEKHQSSLQEVSRKQDEFMTSAQSRIDDLDTLVAQARVLAMKTDHIEGLVRTVAKQELQAFQREALDSVEWKLERCVHWLHNANVKLGLQPAGTMFSTDRFREALFEDGEQGSTVRPRSVLTKRAQSARPRRLCGT
jgi:hypothetical protein